jgi:hypothetical protein
MELKEAIRLLPEVKVSHICREQNQAAHNLAQVALKRDMCKTTRFSVPPEIVFWVHRDKPGVGTSGQSCNPPIP